MSRYQFVGPTPRRSAWEDASDTFSSVVANERQRRQQQVENERAERALKVQERYGDLAASRDERDAIMEGFGPGEAPAGREAPEIRRSSVFGQPAPGDRVGSSMDEYRLGQGIIPTRPHTASGEASRTPTGGAVSHGEVRTTSGMVWRPETSARRQEMAAAHELQLGQMRFGEDLQAERERRNRDYQTEDLARRRSTFGAVPGTDEHRAGVLAEDPSVYDELFPEELDPRFVNARKGMMRFQSGLRISEDRARDGAGGGASSRTHLADVGRAVDDTRTLLGSQEREAERFVRPEVPPAGFDQAAWSRDSTAAHGRAGRTRAQLDRLMGTQNRMLAEVTGRPPADFGVEDDQDPLRESEIDKAMADPEYVEYLVTVKKVDPQALGEAITRRMAQRRR